MAHATRSHVKGSVSELNDETRRSSTSNAEGARSMSLLVDRTGAATSAETAKDRQDFTGVTSRPEFKYMPRRFSPEWEVRTKPLQTLTPDDIAAVPMLEGGDFEMWRDRLLDAVSHLPEDQQIRAVWRRLGPKPYHFARGCSAARKNSFAKLMHSLEREFGNYRSQDEALHLFSSLRQRPGQSTLAFENELRNLSNTAFPSSEHTEEQVERYVLKRLVKGLQSLALRQQLAVMKPRNTDEVQECAELMEAARWADEDTCSPEANWGPPAEASQRRYTPDLQTHSPEDHWAPSDPWAPRVETSHRSRPQESSDGRYNANHEKSRGLSPKPRDFNRPKVTWGDDFPSSRANAHGANRGFGNEPRGNRWRRDSSPRFARNNRGQNRTSDNWEPQPRQQWPQSRLNRDKHLN